MKRQWVFTVDEVGEIMARHVMMTTGLTRPRGAWSVDGKIEVTGFQATSARLASMTVTLEEEG